MTTRASTLNSLTNICVSITINVVHILIDLYVVMRQPEMCVAWEPVTAPPMHRPDASSEPDPTSVEVVGFVPNVMSTRTASLLVCRHGHGDGGPHSAMVGAAGAR